MNYTSIYIDNQEIDLGAEAVDIPITYSLIDIKNLNNRSGSKTKTVKVPRTEKNDKIFGVAYDLNATNSFDKYIPHFVRIEENTEVVFNGLVKLSGVTESEIQFFCYGELSKFKGISGTKTLQELNLTDLNHIYDETIFDTWDDTYPTDVPHDYFYPVIDYGQFYQREAMGDPENVDIFVVDLFPGIYLNRLIRQICLDNGYTLVTSFFDDPQTAKILLPFTNESFVHDRNYSIEANGFLGYGERTEILAGTTGTENVPVTIEEFDVFNQWNNSTFEFTASFDQQPSITLQLAVEISNASSTLPAYLLFEVDSGSGYVEIERVPLEAPTFPFANITLDVSQTLLTGDKFRFVIEKNETCDLFVTANSLSVDPSLQDNLISEGEIVQCAINLPPIKQIDLFKWCYQQYNWIINVDDSKGVIYIDTVDDFYVNNTTKDYSGKLNLSIEPLIKYDSLDFARKYDFKYTHDPTDFFLGIQDGKSESASGVKFGDGKLYLTSEGEASLIGVVGFSPSVIVPSFNGGSTYTVELLTMLNASGGGTTNPDFNTNKTPRVLINAGYIPVSKLSTGGMTSLYIQGGIEKTEIPLCYFQKKIYNDDVDIFDLNLSFQINEGKNIYTKGNLIDWYYKKSLLSLSVSAQVTAYFDLNSSDVSNIDYSELWFIDYFEAFFRLNSINDYLPSKLQPTKVELIKVGIYNSTVLTYQ